MDKSGLPAYFALHQNYSNPFNPTTIINYELPARSAMQVATSVVGGPIKNYVELDVYNLLGEKETTLVNKRQAAGTYTVAFNWAFLPSGLYFYKINAGKFTAVRKMILMK